MAILTERNLMIEKKLDCIIGNFKDTFCIYYDDQDDAAASINGVHDIMNTIDYSIEYIEMTVKMLADKVRVSHNATFRTSIYGPSISELPENGKFVIKALPNTRMTNTLAHKLITQLKSIRDMVESSDSVYFVITYSYVDMEIKCYPVEIEKSRLRRIEFKSITDKNGNIKYVTRKDGSLQLLVTKERFEVDRMLKVHYGDDHISISLGETDDFCLIRYASETINKLHYIRTGKAYVLNDMSADEIRDIYEFNYIHMCKDCQSLFTIDCLEQTWFECRGLSVPKRCRSCRDKRSKNK